MLTPQGQLATHNLHFPRSWRDALPKRHHCSAWICPAHRLHVGVADEEPRESSVALGLFTRRKVRRRFREEPLGAWPARCQNAESAAARGQQPGWERRSAAKGSVAEQFCGSLPPCLRAWRGVLVAPSFPRTSVPPKARFCPGYNSAPHAGWHFSAAWKERSKWKPCAWLGQAGGRCTSPGKGRGNAGLLGAGLA